MTELEINHGYTPENENIPEKLTEDDLKWFAGALEAGGTMGLRLSNATTPPSSFPFLRIHEADEQLIDNLYSRFGGSKGVIGNSFFWNASTNLAQDIIIEAEPYLVSRSEMQNAVHNWTVAPSDEEKVFIAQEMKGNNRFKEPIDLDNLTEEQTQQVNRYVTLLQTEPAFLAGVLDHRGMIRNDIKGNSSKLNVVVYSKNNLLLKALEQTFGGKTKPHTKKGDIVQIKDYITEADRDQYRWRIYSAQARKVIAHAVDYLKVPPYENWDKRWIDEYAAQMEREVYLTEIMIKAEFAAFEAGRIDKLRTIQELAEASPIGLDAFKERMSHLPLEFRLRRAEAQRATRQLKLSKAQIEEAQQFVIEEVQEYINGSVTTLRTNAELAELLGVPVHIVDRRVTALLPPEVRSIRNHHLRSVNAVEVFRRVGRNKKAA